MLKNERFRRQLRVGSERFALARAPSAPILSEVAMAAEVLMAKKPTALPEVDLDVADVRRVTTTTDPQGETIITLEMAGDQIINIVFGPITLAKLEAMLAKASQAQAEASTIQ